MERQYVTMGAVTGGMWGGGGGDIYCPATYKEAFWRTLLVCEGCEGGEDSSPTYHLTKKQKVNVKKKLLLKIYFVILDEMPPN